MSSTALRTSRMEREEKLVELILKVLRDAKLHDLPGIYVKELQELSKKLKVQAREDIVKNFVAAYMVVRNLMSKSTADRVVASSSKGRRFWEKKLREIERHATGIKTTN